MPSNTTYNPPNSNDFEKTKLNKDAIGIQFTATAGQTTVFDYTTADDGLMTGGGAFYVKEGAQGDTVDFQVLAPDGQGGYVAVNQFITSWFINPDVTSQVVPKAMYPAKIPTGFKMRVVYHSVGISNVWCAVNFDFEKVLL